MGLGYPSSDESPKTEYWRIVFLIPIIPNVLRTIVLLFIFTEDPPGYYVVKGD